MPAGLRLHKPEFLLYHPFRNLSREKLYKNKEIFLPVFVQHDERFLLTSFIPCGIISVSRGEKQKQPLLRGHS